MNVPFFASGEAKDFLFWLAVTGSYSFMYRRLPVVLRSSLDLC